MSLSLVAAFIPMLLMGGIIGRLFREFAIVLSIAITWVARYLPHGYTHALFCTARAAQRTPGTEASTV